MPALAHLIHRVSAPALASLFPSLPAPDPSSLNVVLRSYAPGTRLGPHIDRVDWFTEPVFTLVLRAAHPPREGQVSQPIAPEPGIPFWIPEVDGRLYVLRGPVRYAWTYEIRPLPLGTWRVSVTWRWLQEGCWTAAALPMTLSDQGTPRGPWPGDDFLREILGTLSLSHARFLGLLLPLRGHPPHPHRGRGRGGDPSPRRGGGGEPRSL